MATLASAGPAVKPSSVELTDMPQLMSARRARRLVRSASFVAVYVTMSAHGAAEILDVSKRRVLRMLHRHEVAWVSVLFGSVVIGRPEPISRLPASLEYEPDEEYESA